MSRAMWTAAVGLGFGLALAPQAAQAVSLDRCLELARQHAPVLSQAQAEVARAHGAIREANAARLPTLRFDASYVQNSEIPVQAFDIPGLPPAQQHQVIKLGSALTLDAKATGNYTVFSSGLDPARVHAAEAGERAQMSAREQADADLALRVSQAYYQELGYARLVLAANEALTSATSHLRVSRARVNAGVSPKLDALRAEVDASAREVTLAQVEEQRRLARADLEAAMGVTLAPGDTLDTPGMPTDGAPDSAQALAQALAARPEIATLSHQIEQAHQQAVAAHAARLPQVNLSGTAEYRGPNKNDVFWDVNNPGLKTYNLFAGVAMSLPLFDGGLSSARVAQFEAQETGLEARRQTQMLQVQRELAGAFSDLRVAGVRWRTTESRLRSASEAVRLAEETYKGGTGTATDVLDAVTDLADARAQEAQALMGYWLARAELNHAMGKER